MAGVLSGTEIVIKTEPIDEDYPVIKQEELIIKSEFEDESLYNHIQDEFQNAFDLVTPKEEPIDNEYLSESIPTIEYESKEDPPLRRLSSTTKFQCDYCKRFFVNASYIASHQRLRCRSIHKCHVCGEIFRTYLILQEHLSQHKEIRSPLRRSLPKAPKKSPNGSEMIFKCHSCKMTFKSSESLTKHNRVHDGCKHICNKCGKSFKYLVGLRNHRTGDTCVREAIADVLNRHKRSDESEVIERVEEPEQIIIGSTIITKIPFPGVPMPEATSATQKSTITIKKENEDLVPEVPQPIALIKLEEINQEETSTQDYDELILQELVDRKAKSIAKKKNLKHLITEDTNRIDSPTLQNTDFEEVITSNTLLISREVDLKKIKPKGLYESSDEEASQNSTLQASLQQTQDDFEEMIASNMLPNFQNKTEVIESLKAEYQKAKRKKYHKIAVIDESSQNSSSPRISDSPTPVSMYFSLSGDTDVADFVRRLDKSYRYTWVCPLCPRRYIQTQSFVRHLTSFHYSSKSSFDGVLFELRPEPICANKTVADNYCHLCHVILADAATFQKHKNELHKEDNSTKLQFRCDKCGKYCSTRSTLADHVQANCGTEPQYGCAVCGKKFYTKSTLNLHKTMHTGELPYNCKYCQKRFRTRGQLTVHTRTHTGERPFPCKVCERRFTHRETLIAHLSRHIDMKRYKCDGCQMFFSCISGLKTHRLTRMSTCGRFKLNARPVGPRVRVIKGNVIFEPQPKNNPYARRDKDDSKDTNSENNILQETKQNQENISDLVKIEPISMEEEKES